jgi:hypothetical protein
MTISNRKQVSDAIMKHIPAFLFFFLYKGFERMRTKLISSDVQRSSFWRSVAKASAERERALERLESGR